MIVPNSNLISGIVKNRVRGDRTGRLSFTVSVLRNQDPVKAAEQIAACAQAHPDILRDPPPRVVFRKIGDPFLEFEMFVWISERQPRPQVQTELNFAVCSRPSQRAGSSPLGPGSSIVTIQGTRRYAGCHGRDRRTFIRRARPRSRIRARTAARMRAKRERLRSAGA